jgi:transposase
MSSRHGSCLSEQSRKRLQGGELILKELDDDEIAFILDVHESSVWRWRKILRENNDDISCLTRKKGSGRLPSLSDDKKQRLKEIILAGAVEAGYPSERWTSRNVADLIRDEFGVEMTSRNVRHILPTLGLSPQKPVVRSHKYSDDEVLRWGRNAWKRIKKKRRNSAQP